MANLADYVINASLDGIETGLGASPLFRVLSGAMPANTTAADAGTVLASGTLAADWATAAASAQKSLVTSFGDTSADATGIARYLRLYRASDSACGFQGLISEARVASTAYVLNQQIHNGSAVYVVTTAGTTAAGTGPTATSGTGIADGTAVLSFVALLPEFLITPSTSLTLGQQFTVSSLLFNAQNQR